MKVNLIKRSDGLLEPYDSKAVEIIDGLAYRPYEFSVDEVRGLSQNAISHVWYNRIDKQLCTEIGSTKRMCKLHYGVPILRGEDEGFRNLYDKAFKNILSYEEKLKAMDYLPVTRLMNKEQMSRYLEAIQVHYAEMGIILE